MQNNHIVIELFQQIPNIDILAKEDYINYSMHKFATDYVEF